MERPKCETCPYWDARYDDSDGSQLYGEFIPPWSADREDHGQAECHRNAPVGSLEKDGSDMTIDKFNGYYHYEWPVTNGEDTCGEHPSFPEYIRSLKGGGPSETEDVSNGGRS